jgi:hypothetical protein
VLVLGQYPDGRRFIYSPLADVAACGNKEIEWDDNAFNRSGDFVVFEKAEVKAMCEKFMGIVNFQELAPTDHLSLLKPEVRASIEQTRVVIEGVPIVPVYSKESARHFVDPNLVEPYAVDLDGMQFQTAPLAIGAHFSLLGIGQTQSLLEAGILDMTDAIDADIRLRRVYFHLETLGKEDEVITVDVSKFRTAQAEAHPPSQLRHMQITFHEDVALVAGALTVKGEPSKILTNGWVPKVTVTGTIHLELADTQFQASRIESFKQYNDDSLVRIKVIGYALDAKRINHNRRPRKAA